MVRTRRRLILFLSFYLFLSLLIITRLALLGGIRWCVRILKFHWIVRVLFPWAVFFMFHMVIWSNFNFLHNYQVIIILLFWEFFSSNVSWWIPLESEWQQDSSGFQDSYYFGRSQQCCRYDDVHSFSYFQVLHSLYQSSGDGKKCVNYNWYHHHFHIP